jgi:hypothetical protein
MRTALAQRGVAGRRRKLAVGVAGRRRLAVGVSGWRRLVVVGVSRAGGGRGRLVRPLRQPQVLQLGQNIAEVSSQIVRQGRCQRGKK